MKRDFDLIKEIMLQIESANSFREYIPIKIKGYDEIQIQYHTKLLIEENFIDGRDLTDSAGADFKALCLTWQGHEFLDAAKNKKLWVKTKSAIAKNLESTPFSVFRELLVSFVKESVFNQ